MSRGVKSGSPTETLKLKRAGDVGKSWSPGALLFAIEDRNPIFLFEVLLDDQFAIDESRSEGGHVPFNIRVCGHMIISSLLMLTIGHLASKYQ